MKIIALTGGIATGKSSALKIFRRLGAETIDADEIVGKLYRKESIKEMLVLNFGGGAVSGNGTVDRKFLARGVFSDRKSRELLNALVHPLVDAEIWKKIAKYRKRHGKSNIKNKKTKNLDLMVVEVPLLYESKGEKKYDKVVVVGSSKSVQLKRLAKLGISKKEAGKRIGSQISLGKKAGKADFVIDNNGNRKELETGVKKVFEKLIN